MDLTAWMSYARVWAGGRPRPLHVNYELTHQCNLDCVYCDRHSPRPDELTFPQVQAALEGLLAAGMSTISIDGGEPLTHPRVDVIVAWLADRGVTVRMNTNGILVPRKRETVRRLSKVKISLDGPREVHDALRGAGAYNRAVRGVTVARELGVRVELTCTVACHNEQYLESLLDLAGVLGAVVVFQPARNSLFVGEERDGSSFTLPPDRLRAAFARLEDLKRAGRPVGNRWASLRHFRHAPDDTDIPCTAGLVEVTMDPAGNLYHCGQVRRGSSPGNVVRLGVAEAFERMPRFACRQCWCARQVEGNYLWGGRLDAFLPPRR